MTTADQVLKSATPGLTGQKGGDAAAQPPDRVVPTSGDCGSTNQDGFGAFDRFQFRISPQFCFSQSAMNILPEERGAMML